MNLRTPRSEQAGAARRPRGSVPTRGSSGRRLRRAASLALLIVGFAASSAHASVSMCNVPMTMSDGTVLRANIYLPSTSGRYPTILTATGYNKDAGDPTGQNCESSRASPATNRV